MGRATLYRLLDQGTVPSVRVASLGSRRGRILVVRAGLESFVAGLTPAPEPHPLPRPESRRRPSRRVDVDALRARIIGITSAREAS